MNESARAISEDDSMLRRCKGNMNMNTDKSFKSLFFVLKAATAKSFATPRTICSNSRAGSAYHVELDAQIETTEKEPGKKVRGHEFRRIVGNDLLGEGHNQNKGDDNDKEEDIIKLLPGRMNTMLDHFIHIKQGIQRGACGHPHFALVWSRIRSWKYLRLA